MAHILIVDDEEMDRLQCRVALEDAGHQLLFAPDGETALRAFQKYDIDVVITDLVMPNTNGFLLIQQLLEEDERALIIAVSGVSPEHLDRAGKMGAMRTLAKPLGAHDLLKAVDQVLEIEAARRLHDAWG